MQIKFRLTYYTYHQNLWTEIQDSLRHSGIISAEIFNIASRPFMISEAEPSFSFKRKTELDAVNEKVQKCKALMMNFQQKLPNSKPSEKWILMDKIYDLNN